MINRPIAVARVLGLRVGYPFPIVMRLTGSLAAAGYITKPRRKCTQCGTPARACAHDRDHQPCRVRKLLRLPELVAAGPPDIAQMGALAENHGLELGEPPWLADIMSRYHLRPPPS